MKKWLKIIIVIIFLIALGFLIGLITPNGGTSTLLDCPCSYVGLQSMGSSDTNYSFSGEKPCNSVSSYDTIFSLVIFSITKGGRGKEIIICQDGKQIGERDDIDKSSIKYKWGFYNPLNFFINLFRGIGNIFEFLLMFGFIVILILIVLFIMTNKV
jgi:hypothetical protein